MSVYPVQGVGATPGVSPADPAVLQTQPSPKTSFANMMTGAVEQVNQKMVDADTMVRAFALDDSVPLHQVTFAIEKARTSFEMMLQVRAQLVSAYQEFSRMEL